MHHRETIGAKGEGEQQHHRGCPTNCLLLSRKFQGPAHLIPSRTVFSSSSQKAALSLTFKEAKVSFSFSSSFTIYLHLHPQQLSWHPFPHIQQSRSTSSSSLSSSPLQSAFSHCVDLYCHSNPTRVRRMDVEGPPSNYACLLLLFREEISKPLSQELMSFLTVFST